MTQIERIRSGDETVIESIYKDYRNEFISWLMKMYKCSPADAREIFQSAVITFYENVVGRKLDALTCTLKTYLFAIGRKKYLEKMKSERRFEQNVDEDSLSDNPENQVSDAFQREGRLEQVEQCLQKLGEPGRTILELYYYHGKTMQEIAVALNYKNSSTAKNLKYKCLNRLKRIVMSESQAPSLNQFAY